MRRDRRRSPSGFTLVEVVVALAIGSIAILVAAAMLGTASRLTEYVGDRARTSDERGAGELLLRRLIGQMTWSRAPEPAPVFASRRVRFSTWCDMPAGWQEPCVADLILVNDAPTDGISARLSTGERLELIAGRQVLGFLYLVRAERGGTWSERWADGSSLPTAIGVVTPTDTLIVRIGERG